MLQVTAHPEYYIVRFNGGTSRYYYVDHLKQMAHKAKSLKEAEIELESRCALHVKAALSSSLDAAWATSRWWHW